MPTQVRKPLSHPPEGPLFEKRYGAVICVDGTLLPIEERLGRRLLRTLQPECRQARELLQKGRVNLVAADGRTFKGMRIEDVYDRLGAELRERLAVSPASAAWRASCRASLETLARRKRALARDH